MTTLVDNLRMRFTKLAIEGAWLAEFEIWKDERGSFREWYKNESPDGIVGDYFSVEQANISVSTLGTLRGIHYSLSPKGQAKWITCVYGAIKDVIVDIRIGSPTFGRWIEVELSGDSGKAIYIAEGLGHSFLSLIENSTVAYLVSSQYSEFEEFGINPLDEKLGIVWGVEENKLKLSKKDREAPTLEERLQEQRLPKWNSI